MEQTQDTRSSPLNFSLVILYALFALILLGLGLGAV